MDINIDDLSSNVIFSKENEVFYNIVNRGLKNSIICSFNISQNNLNFGHTFLEKQFLKFGYDIDNIDKFIDDQSSLYWFLFFDYIINSNLPREIQLVFMKENSYQIDEAKYSKFLNHIINTYLPKIFELYEKGNEEPPFRNFYAKKQVFHNCLKTYINKNFENLHNTFGGFLFLMQNIESPLIESLINVYEKYEMFSKYFNTFDKIERNDYQNFRKFWYYLITYQKIPLSYVYKYVINFEKDDILKTALNIARYHNHYWSKIEDNRQLYKRLKKHEIGQIIFNKI